MSNNIWIVMENFLKFVNPYMDHVLAFMFSVTNPNHRLYVVYILISVIVAFLIFVHHQRKYAVKGGFLSFLFPKSVWENPSAWLDVRYFFFHGLTGKFFTVSIGSVAFLAGINLTLGLELYEQFTMTSPYGGTVSVIIGIFALFILMLFSDFIAFCLHYLQHKIPLLWQFHKVHHAGEVMHPMSNFREHPIDNLTYSSIINFGFACLYGLLIKGLGYTPVAISALGFSIFGSLFNLCAYHLRHSHIWLRWPGHWSKAFASPAHHHVHHSCHPDHLDKNFAFMFPFWDVIFGTYVMPEDNRDIKFGIVEDSTELNTCLNLYFVPFRDAYRLFKTDSKATNVNAHELEV